MKIGIMLRHFDQHGGGVKNYTNNILNELFSLESPHEFILIYTNSKSIGTFSHFKNVREIALKIPTRFLWDQVGIPWVRQKEKIDVIFNPKYSLPLFINCPTVFVCHGLDYYLMPWGSKWYDTIYKKYLYPLYAAKASLVIAVSNTIKEHLVEFLNIEEEKVRTVYLGVGCAFRKATEEDEQKKIKSKYRLPDKFFLYVGQIYPPKNVGRLLKAYAKVGPKRGIYLVIAGEERWLVEKDMEMTKKLGITEWVLNTGWIDHNELAHFYSLAHALVLPSLYEAFPSPILEAMASNCPVLTSNRFGTKEVAGDAALLINPDNIESISNGLEKINDDINLREELKRKGKKRSLEFHWKKSAEETLDVLEKAYSAPRGQISLIKFLKLQKTHKELIIQKNIEF